MNRLVLHRARSLGLVLALTLATASPAAGQGGCQFGPGSGDFRSNDIPGAGRVTYVGKPHFVCADGVHIWADSAVAYSAQSMSHLLGNVRYLDRTRELRADEARYFTQQARIQAHGNVFLRDTIQGSEIENGDLVYLRQTSFRDEEQITVTTGADGVRPVARLLIKPKPDTTSAEGLLGGPGRPPMPAPDAPPGDSAASTAILQDADTAASAADPDPLPNRGAPADTSTTPYVVEGDRIFLQGSQYFLATGDVVIDRDSLNAFADTAEYDQVAERMLLRGSARVEGDSYNLVGKTINIGLPGGQMNSVRALREALLVGEDLRLTAPLIQIYLNQGAMERLVAVPLPGDPSAPPRTAADSADLARPVAEAEQFRLTADSLEVLAPGEVLDRIFAAGNARGESSARDSLNVPSLPEIALKDWLEGDTVIATFSKVERDPLMPPPDSATDEYRLDQLRAVGSAKSLYRLLPSDSASRPGVDPPAVHYVTGSSILIRMAQGEVDHMEVDGPTRGWHWEPQRRPAGRDSLVAPDSAVAPPDTSLAPPDTATASPPAAAAQTNRSRKPAPVDRGGEDAALPTTAPGQRGRGRRSRR